MKRMTAAQKALVKLMPYQEKLRGYERAKQTLLSELRDLPAKEFAERLHELQEDWEV